MDSGRLAGNDFHSFVSDDAQNDAVRERIKAARAALQTRGCIGVMMRRNMMRGYLPDRRRKKALNVSSGLLYLFDAWQFMNHAVIHPSGRCFAAFKSVR
ncbi:hypothetical protein, partial [Pantoea ananatis]|uniref:hypothetical protein n=1 Tax=Pantoea ananas TaxID=553 RepID=UPI0023B0939F